MGSIAYGRRFFSVFLGNQPYFNREPTIDRWLGFAGNVRGKGRTGDRGWETGDGGPGTGDQGQGTGGRRTGGRGRGTGGRRTGDGRGGG